MKLIVAGSTGLIGTELVRQALLHPAITSVVALARRSTPAPAGASPEAAAFAAKLRSVVCADFENYSDSVQRELAGSDACIWSIAITPTMSKLCSWDQVCKTNRDMPIACVRHLSRLPPRPGSSTPFRFIYMSGGAAIQPPAPKPLFHGAYRLMRGEVEVAVLDTAQQSNGAMEAQIVKPFIVYGASVNWFMNACARLLWMISSDASIISIEQIAAALIDQVVNGFEKDTLLHADLTRIGESALVAARAVKDAPPV